MELGHKKFFNLISLFFIIFCWIFISNLSLHASEERIVRKPSEESSDWWNQAKFGLFIHWGIYSVPADSTGVMGLPAPLTPYAEWYLTNKMMQVKDYQKFAQQFNPINFNAKKWVATAKRAGVKYIIFTAKHHDGFSMFATKLSKFNMLDSTPFARDPLKELAEEANKQGIILGVYYSIMDWHHDHYLPRRIWEWFTRPASSADFNIYLQYLKGQLQELLTQYGPIKIVWFDGGWEHTPRGLKSNEIINLIRSLAPGALINDRLDWGGGDFTTPERYVPFIPFPSGRKWETCMTMNDTWGYTRNDHHWKSAEELIHTLIKVTSKGGNFLLNIGPKEDGEFPKEGDDILLQIGEWLKNNGESIYGAKKCILTHLKFNGVCTVKEVNGQIKYLYLHVFNWEQAQNGHKAQEDSYYGPYMPIRISITDLKKYHLKIEQITSVNQNSQLEEKLFFKKEGKEVVIYSPSRIDTSATVIRIKLSNDNYLLE